MEACLGEICYVLTSKRLYALSNEQVAEMVRSLLTEWQVHIVRADVHVAATNILSAHPALGFEDALLAANAIELKTEIVSYDRHFDRVDGVRRVEP